MSTQYSEVLEMSDEEIDEYLDVALAMGSTTGFSKGTANVSQRDLKKLRPLIKFYAKKPHPFRACVSDNRKRFGSLTEKYCAIIKDLIVGNTKWRNQGKKKNLSQETLRELFTLEIPDGFFAFLSELTDEEVQEMMSEEESSEEFAEGDVAWNSADSWNAIRRKLEDALNGIDNSGTSSVGYDEYATPSYGGIRFWVTDVSDGKALVCEGGKDYYVVTWSQDKKGNVSVQPEEEWTAVTQEWVEEKVGLSNEPDLMAEMFFAETETKKSEVKEEGGLVWKPIMREGDWKYSPSGGAAAPKPIKIIKDGESSRKDMTISMAELKANFEANAIEHVTIPASHKDTVLENTGFIRKLRLATDKEGRAILEAGMDFTEPDVKAKALRGTIANTSAGIHFDYIHKESGKKFRSVLAHAALTNRPWLNGMKPFGVNASEDLQVIGFSEGPINEPANAGGGERMTEVAFDISELGFNSADELKAALKERAALKAKDRERDVAELCQKWQDDGKTPALVVEAQAIMLSDDGTTVLNLSEEGKEVSLSASDIVKRLVEKSASVKLAEEPVTEEDASKEKPDNEDPNKAELSDEERFLASHFFFEESIPMADAVEKAKKQLAAKAV